MGIGSNWLVELQGMPEYKAGWEAYERRESRDSNPVLSSRVSYIARMAWYQGWDDAKFDEYMESVNDDPERLQ